MINTSYTTFEISFKNSINSLIFNCTIDSVNQVVNHIKDSSLLIDKVKQYDKSKGKFKKIPLQTLIDFTDFNTEFNIMLTNKKFNTLISK